MKIESARGVGAASSPKRAGQAAAAGFSPATEAPAKTTAASSVSAVTPLDAILALQAEDPAQQRRARQARRGRAVLDALSDLEKALVLGRAAGGLKTQLENLRRGAETTGDEGLDGVMLEIDTRLAVELAKLERLSGRT
ncbi:flagellar assembly protein FliX [Terricaulis sp.]|uniref:flagellar assembly protein FliX n=1 Tax=Terricaulis sp. TaxID=2768686 RepID=UPI0037849B03